MSRSSPSVIVTGAAGFLGTLVVQRLRLSGTPVIGVARTNQPNCHRTENYRDCPEGDVLIHLAQTNVRAAITQMDLAVDLVSLLIGKGFERIVYASSAILYGDRHSEPRREDAPIFVEDAYSRMKFESEQRILASRNGVVARLTNLYGPGTNIGNVFDTILRQVPGHGPLVVRDTAPVRDFLFGTDAADCLVKMALGEAAGLFNVGSGQETSIGQLATLILDCAGEVGRPVVASAPSERLSHLVIDNHKAQETWDWQPEISLIRGIQLLCRTELKS